MNIQIGTPEHKAQLCEELIKTYQENIWKDELNLMELDELLGQKRIDLAGISLKLDRKEFNTVNEGRKAEERAKSEN